MGRCSNLIYTMRAQVRIKSSVVRFVALGGFVGFIGVM